MIRLIPKPGLLTGIVVSASVVGGLLFGVAAVSSALAARMVVNAVAKR